MSKNEKKVGTQWQGIVKVQRPLASNESMSLVLVYNEDRSIQEQFELGGKDLLRLFPTNEDKAYWNATLNDQSQLHFIDQAAWQPW